MSGYFLGAQAFLQEAAHEAGTTLGSETGLNHY